MIERAVLPTLLVAALPLSALRAADPSEDPLVQARARGTLTLSDALRVSVRSNERVGLAREGLTQALLVRKAAVAEVLPHVDLLDSYFRQNSVTLPVSPGSETFTSFADTRREIRLNLTQPLFHGFRERGFLRSAASSIEANRFGLEEARRVLYADVAAAFYSALQREGERKALEDTVQLERERYREVQARHAAGLARRTEVLLIKSQLEEDESRLTGAKNLLQVAREQLGNLMTIPTDLPLQDDLDLPEVPVPPAGAEGEDATLSASLARAQTSRSDLKQRQKEVEAARYQIAVARGELYPSVDLEANRYLLRQHVSDFAHETDWTAQLTFSMPLFDGGRIRSNVLTAKSKLREAELTLSELARQVELDVKDTFLTLQSDAATLATLEASVEAADENSRLILEEYRQGLATNLEVIAGQNQLLSARLNQEHQKYQVRLDWVALKLVQGLVPEGQLPDLWVSANPNPPEQSQP